MKKRMQEFYMDVARRTSQLSYAVKLKVGAILVKNDNIISFSWNGSPRGWDNNCEDKSWMDENSCNDLSQDEIETLWPYIESDVAFPERFGKRYALKTKSCVTHAEEALLMKIAASHENSEGASLFCTHACCMNCAKLIYGAKISEFYYVEDYRSDEGIKFLESCGIKVEKLFF